MAARTATPDVPSSPSGSGLVNPDGNKMLVLSSAPQAENPSFILFVVAVVTIAIFWRFLLKVGISVIITGFIFMLVSGLLEIIHSFRALIP
jgi:hypothetical protein